MVPRGACWLLALLTLQSGACVAVGYDFDDYEPASASSGGSLGVQPAPEFAGGDASEPGRATGESSAASTGGGAAGQPPADGADEGCITLTRGDGGAPPAEVPEEPTAHAGAAGDTQTGGGEGGGAGAPECEPQHCWGLGAQCGPIDDGCGGELDCGRCFWWFEACAENRCIIPY